MSGLTSVWHISLFFATCSATLGAMYSSSSPTSRSLAMTVVTESRAATKVLTRWPATATSSAVSWEPSPIVSLSAPSMSELIESTMDEAPIRCSSLASSHGVRPLARAIFTIALTTHSPSLSMSMFISEFATSAASAAARAALTSGSEPPIPEVSHSSSSSCARKATSTAARLAVLSVSAAAATTCVVAIPSPTAMNAAADWVSCVLIASLTSSPVGGATKTAPAVLSATVLAPHVSYTLTDKLHVPVEGYSQMALLPRLRRLRKWLETPPVRTNEYSRGISSGSSVHSRASSSIAVSSARTVVACETSRSPPYGGLLTSISIAADAVRLNTEALVEAL